MRSLQLGYKNISDAPDGRPVVSTRVNILNTIYPLK